MIKDIINTWLKHDPKIGEIWVFDDDDPFKTYEVKVLDVKYSWVKYYISDLFPKETSKIHIFKYMYKKK